MHQFDGRLKFLLACQFSWKPNTRIKEVKITPKNLALLLIIFEAKKEHILQSNESFLKQNRFN